MPSSKAPCARLSAGAHDLVPQRLRACCRQVVPISEAEAHHLRELVERLPQPHQATIRTRFAVARERFERAGLLDRLRQPGQLNDEQRQTARAGLLSTVGRMSVSRERGVLDLAGSAARVPRVPGDDTCRELLTATRRASVSVDLPGRASVALGELGTSTSERGVWWLPLILALEWTAAHPLEPHARPTQQLSRDVLGALTRQRRPATAKRSQLRIWPDCVDFVVCLDALGAVAPRGCWFAPVWRAGCGCSSRSFGRLRRRHPPR